MSEQPEPIAAFIFDMDGTLIDNMSLHRAAWGMFLGAHGLSFSDVELHRKTHGTTNREILRDAFGARLDDVELERLSLAKEELYRSEFRAQIRALPGLEPFLNAARAAGIPLALATSAIAANVELVFELTALAPHFELVLSAEHVARGKPDPEVFLLAAERLGVTPDRCLVFEDSLPGLEAAYRAHMPAIAVATGHAPELLRALPGVVDVISDYRGLAPSALLAHSRK